MLRHVLQTCMNTCTHACMAVSIHVILVLYNSGVTTTTNCIGDISHPWGGLFFPSVTTSWKSGADTCVGGVVMDTHLLWFYTLLFGSVTLYTLPACICILLAATSGSSISHWACFVWGHSLLHVVVSKFVPHDSVHFRTPVANITNSSSQSPSVVWCTLKLVMCTDALLFFPLSLDHCDWSPGGVVTTHC